MAGFKLIELSLPVADAMSPELADTQRSPLSRTCPLAGPGRRGRGRLRPDGVGAGALTAASAHAQHACTEWWVSVVVVVVVVVCVCVCVRVRGGGKRSLRRWLTRPQAFQSWPDWTRLRPSHQLCHCRGE